MFIPKTPPNRPQLPAIFQLGLVALLGYIFFAGQDRKNLPASNLLPEQLGYEYQDNIRIETILSGQGEPSRCGDTVTYQLEQLGKTKTTTTGKIVLGESPPTTNPIAAILFNRKQRAILALKTMQGDVIKSERLLITHITSNKRSIPNHPLFIAAKGEQLLLRCGETVTLTITNYNALGNIIDKQTITTPLKTSEKIDTWLLDSIISAQQSEMEALLPARKTGEPLRILHLSISKN
jgi:hypothetical protein